MQTLNHCVGYPCENFFYKSSVQTVDKGMFKMSVNTQHKLEPVKTLQKCN